MKNLIRIFTWKVIVDFIIRWVIGISFRYNKNIDENAQYIYVANHNSHLDTACILAALPIPALKNTHPVAAADYFGKNAVTTFLSEFFLNACLIKRSKDAVGVNPIEKMDDLLKEGKSLILFPEGSRGNPEELQEFKKGIAILLEKNPDVKFVPVFMHGLGKALPKGDGVLVPFVGSITFGRPRLKPDNASTEEIVEYVRRAILELSEKVLYK